MGASATNPFFQRFSTSLAQEIYICVCNANGDGRKQEGYARGGCSCASWLPVNLPHNVCIPARLTRRWLFRALPAEYPANTEVEAREHASADDSYDEQQVSACCAEEQFIGKGPHACYVDCLSPDCLQRNNHNAEDTILDHVARPSHSPLLRSPIYCACTFALLMPCSYLTSLKFSLETFCNG